MLCCITNSVFTFSVLYNLSKRMGIEMSTSYISLRENPLLQVLVGENPIPEGDTFWNEILNFSFCPPHSISDNRLLTDVLHDSLTQFQLNDLKTKHFSRVTDCFLQRAPSLADNTMSKNEIFIHKTLNALFLSRISLQFFIQNQTHPEVIQHFSTKSKLKHHHIRSKSDSFRLNQSICPSHSLPHLSPVIPSRHSPLQNSTVESNGIEDHSREHFSTQYGKLIASLFRVITEVEIKESTMGIHIETIRYLIVILGTLLFSSTLKSDGDSFLFTILSMKKSVIIEVVIRLLDNITQFTAKQPQPVDQVSYLSYVPGYSWLFGANAQSNKIPLDNSPIASQELLRNFSTYLLLLLLLQNPLNSAVSNPYQKVFSTFKDFIDTPPLATPGLVTSYERYYNAICVFLHQEETVLLLYQTLLTHSAMKSYIWSKTEFSHILLPLLETLNSAESITLHHIYMITIILLMMSQDTGFCTCIHTQILDSVLWYRDKKLVDISLGSLLVLSIVNLLLSNIAHLRDQYIHSNCSAILANVAAKIQNLHSIPTQKVINAFEVIAKRYKIVSKNKHSEECNISLIEGILHIVLALINSVLAKNLTSNPQLVYNLIYRKEVFTEFRTHPEFGMLIANIFSVVEFFEAQLKIHAVFNTSDEGLAILEELSRKWPANGLRHFPEQKYKYCEEVQPDEFFIPYIWTLVYRHSGLYWEHAKIRLAWSS